MKPQKRSKHWRLYLAVFLAFASLTLAGLSYANRPTASLMTDEGTAQIRRMGWLAMGFVLCLVLAIGLVVLELTQRHDMQVEAQSPIQRQAYIALLRSMVRRAHSDPATPVSPDDIAQLLRLVEPAIGHRGQHALGK